MRKIRRLFLGMFLVLTFVFLILIVWGALSWHFGKERHVVDLPGDVTVDMTLRHDPLSFHSDYHRWLKVESRKGIKHRKLFKDTGWWRGSQLYRGPDGELLLHEGQNGCFELLRFDGTPVIEKQTCPQIRPDLPADICSSPSAQPPLSMQFEGWTYLGRFFENGFADHSESGECMNNDPL